MSREPLTSLPGLPPEALLPPGAEPLEEDIPMRTAYRLGRRVYISCGYNSKLNQQLLALNARWDDEVGARYVGTQRAEKVLPLIRAHLQRIEHVRAVKEHGVRVSIPRNGSADIRDRAKKLGGIWVEEAKQWAMPTAEAAAEVERLVADKRAAGKKAAAQRRAAKAQEKARAAALGISVEELRAREALEASGRTPTGESTTFTIVSTRRMTKTAAQRMAHDLGEVVKLRDGRRGVVTAVKVWFTEEEIASSVCWHRETHDEAHWDLYHEVAIVEPTEQERAQDEARRAEARDAAELHEAMAAASRTENGRRASNPPASEVAGRIEARYGTPGVRTHRGSTLTLTHGGQVVYHHPGHYDDYIPTTLEVTDPALVEQVEALIAVGPRKRTWVAQMHYEYSVKTGVPS